MTPCLAVQQNAALRSIPKPKQDEEDARLNPLRPRLAVHEAPPTTQLQPPPLATLRELVIDIPAIYDAGLVVGRPRQSCLRVSDPDARTTLLLCKHFWRHDRHQNPERGATQNPERGSNQNASDKI